MRLLLPGCLLGAVLLLPALTIAGGGESTYGLGEPEPLASVAAAPETTAAATAVPPAPPPPAQPVAAPPQPFRVRLTASPQAPPAGPAVSGLRYRSSPSPGQ